MESSVSQVITILDQFRANALRWTLPVSSLRSLFMHRHLRLQVLFLAAATLYLFCALFFPLWVLVIGPIIWGVPHIFASIRYLPKSMNKTSTPVSRLTKTLFALWAAVTLMRVLSDQFQVTPDWSKHLPNNWPELSAAFLTVTAFLFIGKQKLSQFSVGLLLLVPLIGFSWAFPLETAGVLIILHNWIAFIYWHRSCKSNRERNVMWFSFFIFVAVQVLMFFGRFDFLYQSMSPQGFHSWANLDYSDLGRMIAPGSSDPKLWFHLVSIYAFGQALHYFVWLKAIPDQELPKEFSVSFRLSWHYLKEDFGARSLKWISLFILGGALAWALLKLPQARALYFSVAAFHGYMEIAGLGFLKFNRIQK